MRVQGDQASESIYERTENLLLVELVVQGKKHITNLFMSRINAILEHKLGARVRKKVTKISLA
jgi:hypothetical protein